MKKYNFDETVDRIKTSSYKWNVIEQEYIPLWVADMDFRIADEITDALVKRANQGAFGYIMTPDEYYESQILWWKKRHHTEIKKDWIQKVIGVIPALTAIIAAYCNEGDEVIIQPPVYNHFHMSIEKNGAKILKNELINKNNTYYIDFDDFEKLAKRDRCKLFILCNPHNPVGRCWTEEELTKLGEICCKNNVIVVADEIHRDLVFKGYKYTPFLSLSQEIVNNSITCTAPSKTFNLAGLKVANMIIPNKDIYETVGKKIELHEVSSMNGFGISGLISAYKYGDNWLDQLMEYLNSNKNFVIDYFKEKLPEAKITELQATYLMWIDLSEYLPNIEDIQKDMLDESKVLINPGINYSDYAKKSIRINIATSRKILKEGLDRIFGYIRNKGSI